MFHKLRLKLTLINATIIFLLFILLIAGTYYFSHEKIIRLSDTMAEKIMSDLNSGFILDMPSQQQHTPGDLKHHDKAFHPFRDSEPPDKGLPLPFRDLPPNDMPPGPNFFFVKLSPTGTVTAQSPNQSLSNDELQTLINFALQDNMTKGVIVRGENEYRYLKAPMSTTPGTILLFQDFARENNMLRIQLTALTVAGLICLILSFLGSFFMANRAMASIQQAWQQQKDFLSDASHELRTPLTVIQTNLEVVLGNQDEPVANQKKWLNNIQEESVNMAKLVDSLLFLARADSKQQLLSKTTFSFTNALIEATAPFETLAEAKGLALDVLSAKPEMIGFGDKDRIKQVISILLDNAIRHTSAGKVCIRLTQSAHKIILTITDSGEGIAPEYLNKIFDRFYQIDKARSNGGAGLGLAIAKCIIENHNGSIQVASTPGFGTTFTIQLPGQ